MGRRARARRSSRFPSASAMARPRGTLVLLLVAALAATGVAQAQPGSEFTVDEVVARALADSPDLRATRSEEHTSELQSRLHLVCRLLLEKKKIHAGGLPLVDPPS